MEVVDGDHGRNYILDVAHNPAGIRTLIDSLPAGLGSGLISVFGVLKDKEYRPMLRDLARVSRVIVPVTPAATRALPAKTIYGILRKQGIRVTLGGTVGRGIAKARAMAGSTGHILITGSHYVVGEALEYLAGVKRA
jgi:dihydrofolate synthase/folylpolyglutamate synthase